MDVFHVMAQLHVEFVNTDFKLELLQQLLLVPLVLQPPPHVQLHAPHQDLLQSVPLVWLAPLVLPLLVFLDVLPKDFTPMLVLVFNVTDQLQHVKVLMYLPLVQQMELIKVLPFQPQQPL